MMRMKRNVLPESIFFSYVPSYFQQWVNKKEAKYLFDWNASILQELVTYQPIKLAVGDRFHSGLTQVLCLFDLGISNHLFTV